MVRPKPSKSSLPLSSNTPYTFKNTSFWAKMFWSSNLVIRGCLQHHFLLNANMIWVFLIAQRYKHVVLLSIEKGRSETFFPLCVNRHIESDWYVWHMWMTTILRWNIWRMVV